VVCLVPASTDTGWWHDAIEQASLVVFLRGRLRFGDASHGTPFPSVFIVYRELTSDQVAKLANYGWMVPGSNGKDYNAQLLEPIF